MQNWIDSARSCAFDVITSSFLNRAPALLILESVAAAIYFAEKGYQPIVSVSLSMILVAVQILISEEKGTHRHLLLAIFLLFICCVIPLCTILRLKQNLSIPEKVSGDFLVVKRRQWGDVQLLIFKDNKGNKWFSRAKGELETAREGELFSFSAKIRPLRTHANRSSFLPHKYWLGQGVLGELRDISNYRELPAEFSFHSLRELLRKRISRLPATCRALIGAVFLGDREINSNEDFRRWGISHFLSVSGWHVGFAVLAAVLLFGKGRPGIYVASVFLWLYCFMSGFSASAVRATIMLQIALIASALGMGNSALNAVGIAGTLMLLWNPWIYFDLGWRLSVLAAVITIALPSCGGLWTALLTSPIMWIVSSPLIAPLTGGLYLSSLPINMMATALFSFVMIFIIAAGLPSLCGFNVVLLTNAADALYRVWAVVSDQWTVWLPQALPVNFFPAWFYCGVTALLVGLSLKITPWRAVLLGLIGGAVPYVF